ncbi:NAD(P)H-binding protein [Nocardia thailandica]
MILVTGATGTIGSLLVPELLARGAGVRAFTRDPGAANFPPGVEVARGDFHDPDSVAAALAGAEALFLVGVGLAGSADEVLVEAAVAAGVRRVVELSAIGTGDPALGLAGTWHALGERAVRDSGMAWTILRPSSFASNTLSWRDAIAAGAPVPNPVGTGAQGVIDPRDVASVAAATLVEPGHDGRVYTLTGPDLLTTADQAAILSRTLGLPVAVADIDAATAREPLIAGGTDPVFADGVVRAQAYVAAGGNAVRTGDVEKVLGRPPHSFGEWAAGRRSAFAVARVTS